MVDCSYERPKMSTHCYFEYDGAKGGNNIASMLMNELKRKGLTSGGRVAEINIFFDNCTGQNKNRTVLRLLFL